jgi:hypothetical protein
MENNTVIEVDKMKRKKKVKDVVTKARNTLICENEKRHVAKEPLIIDFQSCNEFFETCGYPPLNERPKNIMLYCLGDRLFDEITKQYYVSKNEFLDACQIFGIDSVDSYKKFHHSDPRLPPLNYIDNGLYYEMYHDFNLSVLLWKRRKDCCDF